MGTGVTSTKIGAILSIQFTVAVVVQVFPAVSVKLKIKDPFPVKVYMPVQEGLWKVTVSFGVQVAITFQLVAVLGLYDNIHVGAVVSGIVVFTVNAVIVNMLL